MFDVTLAAACPHTPLGTGELRRHDALLQPRPRPRDDGLSLESQHSLAPLLDICSPLSKIFPSIRVGAVTPRRPQLCVPPPQGPD